MTRATTKTKPVKKGKRDQGALSDRDIDRASGGDGVVAPRDPATGQATGKRQF